jgi:hypothetical protein
MKKLFEVGAPTLSKGSVITAWGSKGSLLAVGQSTRLVVLLSKHGKVLHEIELDPAANVKTSAAAQACQVKSLVWNGQGVFLLSNDRHVHRTYGIPHALQSRTSNCQSLVESKLAILPAGADFFYLWDTVSKQAEKCSLGAHVPQHELVMAFWSQDGAQVTLGTSKGAMVLYHTINKRIVLNLQGVHEQVGRHRPTFSVRL